MLARDGSWKVFNSKIYAILDLLASTDEGYYEISLSITVICSGERERGNKYREMEEICSSKSGLINN